MNSNGEAWKGLVSSEMTYRKKLRTLSKDEAGEADEEAAKAAKQQGRRRCKIS